ncbi:single-stranded DNA-binding protein [Microbacterium capsulatum]|uniref:Single-stranded DNA-binding protein n=1 Tax=Microbacterium capsulatum TaxID=3041921 RepID=A0ABU0XC04_9MICO|nr:single-stranded DNA-binding protein [Microbacterium sp. ASV81]MDQ4212635.1 single-stranded DNA-binding protein [Microbacterium sp. ASV81]
MADIITVLGNVASSPEPGRTATGIETLTFRLASNNRRPDPKTGEWVDVDTNWFTVHAYRRLAENAMASVSKGDSVIVTGRLKLREWESKEGKRGMSVEIEAESIGADLRWGRSTFQRVSPARVPEPQTGADPSGADGAASVPVGAGLADAGADDAWAASGEQATPY